MPATESQVAASSPGQSRRQLRRVLIADDDALIRTALSELINSRSELELVGAAIDAGEAISMAAALQPDVALLDYRMPGGGDYATREIIRLSPRTAVLCLTAYDDPATESRMRRAGARGFLVKGVSTIQEIVAAILFAAESDGN